MSKHFEVGTPQPLGHRRQTVNAEQADASLERIAAKVAEMIAPTIAEAVAQELKAQGVTANGSNGRKMPSGDITSRYQLPADDHWASYNLNEPVGDEPPRGGLTPTDGYELPD